jgi:hypothetical protein
VDSFLEFLLYPKKFKAGWIPFFRAIKGGADAGKTVGTEFAERSMELRAKGIYDPFGAADLASPAILKYESSALGSSRII